MLGVDTEIGTSALPLWIAAGSAAGLVVVCARALSRGRPGTAPPIGWSGVVLLGVVFGASMAWALLDPARGRDRAAERRALELRAQQLTERVLAPGSALACLDPLVDSGVATACEKALFAAPASVAAAVSYVAAEFTLFSDMVAYEKRGGGGLEATLLPLRRSLEADRFGFLASVLTTQERCTSQDCAPLELLRDTRLIRAHLSVQTLDHYVQHYQADWSAAAEGQVATTAAVEEPERPRKTVVNIDFPSAASIPPVSIMKPEPKGPILPGQAAAAAANPNPEPPFRAGHKQAALPAVASPRPAAEATQTEPVWLPAPQTAPTAPAANVPSGAAAPQHNP